MAQLKIEDLSVHEEVSADEAKGIFGGWSWGTSQHNFGSFGSIVTSGSSSKFTPSTKPTGLVNFEDTGTMHFGGGIGADPRMADSNDSITGDSGAMGSPG